MSSHPSFRRARPSARSRAFSVSFARSRVVRAASTALCVAGLAPPPALAQVAPVAFDPVVVIANRTPQTLSSVLADVSVIDRAQIDRSGVSNVADLLARLPGIEVTRNGGPGTATSVFIRGAEARHTAVYLDGVRLDSQSTGGAVWEQVPIDQIDRIEVLRGPAAAVYGSDAIGGVVQLFTRRGAGAPTPTVAVGYGTYGTSDVRLGASGASGAVDYALSVAHGRSRGFNAVDSAEANPDADGYRRSSASGRLGVQVAVGHRIDAALLASNLRARYDGFDPTVDDISQHQLRTGNLGWQGRWSDAASSRVQLGESRSVYENDPSYYRTETRLRNYLLQHDQRFFGTQLATVTLERREDRLRNDATAFGASLDGARFQNAAALGWRGDFGDHGLQAHLRRDRDSEFGGKTTGSLAYGWQFAPQWRATASGATSFRAPTLYQRFSEYGVASLVPETGRNLELGLRWDDATSEASLVAFRNNVRNLINFGAKGPCASPFGCYENAGRGRYEGVTLAGRTQLAAVALHGSLDWHDPRNVQTDRQLARRARKLGNVGADLRLAGWTLGGEVQASGRRYDDAANQVVLGGYTLVHLVASRTLLPGWVVQGRIDNLTDKRYQLVNTYATAGRAAWIELRWTPQ